MVANQQRSPKHRRIWLIASLCGWMLWPALFGCPAQSTGVQTSQMTLQNISIHALSNTGKGQKLLWRSIFPAKQTTLAVFMTTWCESCERKQPDVLRWAQNNQRRAKTVLIVSGSPLTEVTAMVHKRKIPIPLVSVVSDDKGNVAKQYNIEATPTYMLLSPSGKPLGRFHSIDDVPRKP